MGLPGRPSLARILLLAVLLSALPVAARAAPAGMGPLTGRVDEPGGGVLWLSTAPAGAARTATGSADSRTASSKMRASEGRPGKPMGDGVLVRVEVRSC